LLSSREHNPERASAFLSGSDEASWSFLKTVHLACIGDESNQVIEGRSVDALALRGDEGRGTLR
jgi:hypothetical protein